MPDAKSGPNPGGPPPGLPKPRPAIPPPSRLLFPPPNGAPPPGLPGFRGEPPRPLPVPSTLVSPAQVMSMAPAFRFLNCSATSICPPFPIARTSIIVAEPAIMPMDVNRTLDLFCARFSHTSRNISPSLIPRSSCSQSTRYPLPAGLPEFPHRCRRKNR